MPKSLTIGGLKVTPQSVASIDLSPLAQYHTRIAGAVRWRLTSTGLDVLGDGIKRTPGRPETVARIWTENKDAILSAAALTGVPVELIIATAATESRGNAKAVRREPGYASDSATPHRVSPGIMQTLISTARATLACNGIARAWLLRPENSILAGASYIAQQSSKTLLDPPVVFAAYNAGGVYAQTGARNRWKMRQYPIGTGEHCDRAVLWFNDCFAMFAERGDAPSSSLYALMRGRTSTAAQEAPVAPPAPTAAPAAPDAPSPTPKGKGNVAGKAIAGLVAAAIGALLAWIFGGTGQ